MNLELLRVNRLNFLIRGFDLNMLVNHNLINPNPQNKGALERYKTRPRAIKNAARLATAEGLDAYVAAEVSGKKVWPMGIVTVIEVDPKISPLPNQPNTLHDIDYWSADDASEDLHLEVARQALSEARKLARARYLRRTTSMEIEDGPEPVHDYMATIRTAEPSINRGFRKVMKSLGDPVSIGVDLSGQNYGVDKDGASLELLMQRETKVDGITRLTL